MDAKEARAMSFKALESGARSYGAQLNDCLLCIEAAASEGYREAAFSIENPFQESDPTIGPSILHSLIGQGFDAVLAHGKISIKW